MLVVHEAAAAPKKMVVLVAVEIREGEKEEEAEEVDLVEVSVVEEAAPVEELRERNRRRMVRAYSEVGTFFRV